MLVRSLVLSVLSFAKAWVEAWMSAKALDLSMRDYLGNAALQRHLGSCRDGEADPKRLPHTGQSDQNDPVRGDDQPLERTPPSRVVA